MRQTTPARRGGSGPYARTLDGLDAGLDELAARVAQDVAGHARPDAAEMAASRGAVRWLLASLRQGPDPDAAALRRLRDDASAQARAGVPLRPVLDRALSAGWVTWSAVTARPGVDAAALAALGDALLHTGDAAAAAIADGHAAAERELAVRSASALRELLDHLLELPEGDEAGRARLVRRLAEAGIPADRPLSVVLVDAGQGVVDEDPAVAAVARTLAGGPVASVADPRALGGRVPAPVVAAFQGRLVLLLPQGPRGADPATALERLGRPWTAVSASAADTLGTAGALREAAAGLVVAIRLGLEDRVTPAAALVLERALLAEPVLLAAAVDRELGPLERAPRATGLVHTLEVYLAERENLRATARRLGIAPRTVAYRLARVERILGGPLDAERRLRLATALFARRLAGTPARPAAAPGRARRPGADR